MKVKVLLEQEAVRGHEEERYALASGDVVDIDKSWALALLGRGEAEPVADTAAKAARKAVAPESETR